MARHPMGAIALAAQAALSLLLLAPPAAAQLTSAPEQQDVTAQIRYATAGQNRHEQSDVPAVLWLNPIGRTPMPAPEAPQGRYTLTQKDKMFTPHLLIVPVGTVVLFPNKDPFFHNVFSLFDGKRFDLGLYEAGSSRSVSFSREGVSYIFCNIHPDMSAVVIALRSPLHAIAARDGSFHLHNVPSGDYELHLWVEGQPQAVLDHWVRRVHVDSGSTFLGSVLVAAPVLPAQHLNKFQQPYSHDSAPY